MKRRFSTWLIVLLAISTFVVFSSTSVLFADEQGEDLSPEWGPANFISYSKHHSEFRGVDSTNDNLIKSYDADDLILVERYCSGDCILSTGLQLPQGAHITGWRLDGGLSVDAEIRLALQVCPYNQSTCTDIAAPIVATGTGSKHITKTCSHTVDNYINYYRFLVTLPGTTKFEGWLLGGFLNGGVVFYELQISPAPATQTFSDVNPGAWYFQGVEALAASGITQGCGGGNFCPNVAVTRAQMAVFLARALGLHWDVSDGY